MHPDTAESGRQAEEKVAEFLERNGWRPDGIAASAGRSI